MVAIVLSPYFTVNTQLVANFCRKCYSEEKEEEVFIIAVNKKFLKLHDPKQYQIFINNFPFIPHKFTRKQETHSVECKQLTTFNFYQCQNMMTIKRKIMKKYFKFNSNRKYSNSPSNNCNIGRIQEKILKSNQKNSVMINKQENCTNASTSHGGENNLNNLLIGESIKQEHNETNIDNKARINIEIETKNETNIDNKPRMNIEIETENEKQRRCKIELENSNFKYEKIADIVKNEKWIPPISPHNLIEEKYYNDPWALLVVTIFLNRTSCILALPYMEKFFEDFKGPFDVLKSEVQQLEPYFTKIGLIKTRANQVWRMSFDFVHKDWKHVGELYGVGKYAEDAYRMFHLGDFDVEPTDRYLKIYKAWYEMKQRNEKLGIVEYNSQVYLEDYFIAPEDEDRTDDLKEPN